MNYSLSWKDNICIAAFYGDINIDDVERANKDFYGDKRAYSANAGVWDFSQCSMKDITPKELTYTEAVDLGGAVSIKKFKLAIVVTEPHGVALAIKYINTCMNGGSTWEFKIVDTLKDALEWIQS